MANNNERRWSVPSKRAKGYAEERKAKRYCLCLVAVRCLF